MPDHIYKQIDELNITDLEKFPVWEFLFEDDPNAKDECTVKGYARGWEELQGRFFVRARFVLADQTMLPGFVYPEDGLPSSQPVILIGENRILFWHGVMKASTSELTTYYKHLKRKPEEIFPIRWKIDVDIAGVKSGRIDGFGYYNNVDDYFKNLVRFMV